MKRMAVCLACFMTVRAADPFRWHGNVNFSRESASFMGLGALSGGGGTSRLLYDYSEPQRSQILDALFKPHQGASLQILKVEIGGDGQSTEATEASHMHTRDDLNFNRGYEWWLMKEAKARNPDIKLYGLSWAVPGWVGNGSFYAGNDNIDYHIKWVEGARSAHNLTIDYLGIWNERQYDGDWIVRLRKALDARGHDHVGIVAADTSFAVCDAFAANRTLLDAIAVVGAHYPITRPGSSKSTMPASCHTLDRPLWTSEGWNLGEVNDYAGALNLASTINYNWIEQGQTAMVVWTVIYAWYSILPFAHPDPRDPIGGMGHGLMSADEPWGGHYRVEPPLYAVAHTTQYAHPGCHYIDSSTVMSDGVFNSNTSHASMVAFSCVDDQSTTLVVETASSINPVTLVSTLIPPSWLSVGLQVWGRSFVLRETCENSSFVLKQGALTAQVSANTVQLTTTLQPNCIYTISTGRGQSSVPTASPPIPSPQRFPFPYADNFDSYQDQGTVKYFTDQGGSFNAAPLLSKTGKVEGMGLEQVVDTRPIEWGHNPDPVTIAGDITWTDYRVRVQARIGSTSPLPSPPPLPPPLPPTPEIFSVQAAACANDTHNQSFEFQSGFSTGSNTHIIFDGGKGCLAAASWNTQWHVPLAGVVACNTSDPRQHWSVDRGRLCLAADLGCLNLDGGNTKDGTPVLVWPKNTQKYEQWFATPNGQIAYGTATSHASVCLQAGQASKVLPPSSPGQQPRATSVKVCGRIGSYSRGGSPPNGYCLIVDDNATWWLSNGGSKGSRREQENVIAHGIIPAGINPSQNFVTLELAFQGAQITPTIEGHVLKSVKDTKYKAGMVGLGSGWNHAWFDDLNITSLA